MALLALVLACAVLLLLAYRTYGRFLVRWLGVDDARPTPAVARADGSDFVPASPWVVTGAHFTAIAAAGPIVGPILAGVHFGWVPALLWILLGAIFVGGAHDTASLLASLRHGAASIVEVVRGRMSRTSHLVFLLFVWLSLLYVIIAFTDLTASTFARVVSFDLASTEGAAPTAVVVDGGGVATAALVYLAVSVGVGLGMRYGRWPAWVGAAAGLVAVGAAIWLGQEFPLRLPAGWGEGAWDAALLGYCFLASVLPLWLLLQPRGLLGSLFLYAVLAAGAAGVLVGAITGATPVQWPAFTGFESAGLGPLFPFLFITIACGACSGFHSIVASGTTSRQVARESHVRPIAYGSMLLEAMVAVLALATVMLLPASTRGGSPDAVFAQGMGTFLGTLGVDPAFAITFGLLAFSTFIFDTLDVCTRLGRYIFQELTGWKGRWAGIGATAATLALPFSYLMVAPPQAWRQFWTLFGTSNQLLAALTLVGLAVWMRSRGRNPWPVLGPALLMLGVTGTALVHSLALFGSSVWGGPPLSSSLPPLTVHLNFIIAGVLLILALFVSFEAFRVLRRPRLAAEGTS